MRWPERDGDYAAGACRMRSGATSRRRLVSTSSPASACMEVRDAASMCRNSGTSVAARMTPSGYRRDREIRDEGDSCTGCDEFELGGEVGALRDDPWR